MLRVRKDRLYRVSSGFVIGVGAEDYHGALPDTSLNLSVLHSSIVIVKQYEVVTGEENNPLGDFH